MMKEIDVDACGRCLNNRKMTDEINDFIKLHSPEYYKVLAQYKFNMRLRTLCVIIT